MCTNETLLEHNPCSFVCNFFGYFCSMTAEQNGYDSDPKPCKPTNIVYLALYRRQPASPVLEKITFLHQEARKLTIETVMPGAPICLFCSVANAVASVEPGKITIWETMNGISLGATDQEPPVSKSQETICAPWLSDTAATSELFERQTRGLYRQETLIQQVRHMGGIQAYGF